MTIKELFDDLYDLYKKENEISIAIRIFYNDRYIIIENDIKKLTIRIKPKCFVLTTYNKDTLTPEAYEIQKIRDADELLGEIMFLLAGTINE